MINGLPWKSYFASHDDLGNVLSIASLTTARGPVAARAHLLTRNSLPGRRRFSVLLGIPSKKCSLLASFLSLSAVPYSCLAAAGAQAILVQCYPRRQTLFAGPGARSGSVEPGGPAVTHLVTKPLTHGSWGPSSKTSGRLKFAVFREQLQPSQPHH